MASRPCSAVIPMFKVHRISSNVCVDETNDTPLGQQRRLVLVNT